MKTTTSFKLLISFLILISTSISSYGQNKKKAERQAYVQAQADSAAAYQAALAAETAAMMEMLADSTAAYAAYEEAMEKAKADSTAVVEAKYSGDIFHGNFTYKNRDTFTGYVLNVTAPHNSYADYNFELEVTTPDAKYVVEGFAVKKDQTVEYYYLSTRQGKFPLEATINKKKPLFSLKKVNGSVLTVWGQLKDGEDMKVLFEK